MISALTKMPSSSQNCLFPFISLTLSTRNKNMSRIYYQILSSETWAASCCRLPCQDTDPACEEQCPRLPTTIILKFWILLAEVLLIRWTLPRWFWHRSQDQEYSGWIPFSGGIEEVRIEQADLVNIFILLIRTILLTFDDILTIWFLLKHRRWRNQ